MLRNVISKRYPFKSLKYLFAVNILSKFSIDTAVLWKFPVNYN